MRYVPLRSLFVKLSATVWAWYTVIHLGLELLKLGHLLASIFRLRWPIIRLLWPTTSSLEPCEAWWLTHLSRMLSPLLQHHAELHGLHLPFLGCISRYWLFLLSSLLFLLSLDLIDMLLLFSRYNSLLLSIEFFSFFNEDFFADF